MRKHVIRHTMFNQADTTTETTSDPTSVSQVDYGSILLQWTDVAVDGSIVVQGTNAKFNRTEDLEDADWEDLDFGSTITMDNTVVGLSHNLVLTEMPFTAIRLKFTNNAGTGVFDAKLVAKSKGA